MHVASCGGSAELEALGSVRTAHRAKGPLKHDKHADNSDQARFNASVKKVPILLMSYNVLALDSHRDLPPRFLDCSFVLVTDGRRYPPWHPDRKGTGGCGSALVSIQYIHLAFDQGGQIRFSRIYAAFT